MNSNIIQGGSTANLNGRIFEDTLIPMFKQHGYQVFSNAELKSQDNLDRYSTSDKVILTNAPFQSIYKHQGKTEFLLTNRILKRDRKSVV